MYETIKFYVMLNFHFFLILAKLTLKEIPVNLENIFIYLFIKFLNFYFLGCLSLSLFINGRFIHLLFKQYIL